MKSSLKAFITGIGVCAFSLCYLSGLSNNIRMNGSVRASQGTGDTVVLSFPLQWDNSWRDEFNWDAAWVFLKYRSGTGDWNHVNLCAGGHRFVNSSGQPVPFEAMPGITGTGFTKKTVGLFIYRNTPVAGNTPEITCQLKCLKSSLGNIPPEQFNIQEGFIVAQAIEMVCVPYGAYYLGDGSSQNRFSGTDKKPVLIDSEAEVTASTATKVHLVTNNTAGSAQSIAALYPKGYQGFYMMKYEVSQEQWVYFLNTLTYAQQQECIPNLEALKKGEYISGNKNVPSSRNGIIVAEPFYNGRAMFATNLNNNSEYSENADGKYIACNYLSPSDMLAYCSWAGLRPMSELEYEKACRQNYPEQPVPNEFAWHDSNIAAHLSAITNEGMRNERSGTANANVNAGNNLGPVRCGLFATGTSTQTSAGATFWGAMDMSGNLKEMCFNLSYSAFSSLAMGLGIYNTGLWNVTAEHFGVRGGGFASPDNLLRVSDRTEASSYFTTLEQRDHAVGFRAVRPVGSEITVTQGVLTAKQGSATISANACPGNELELTTKTPAKVMSGSYEVPNMNFSYVWYVLKPGATVDSIIPGAVGETLYYNDLKVYDASLSVTYKFKRKVICPLGEATTAYISFTVPNMNITLTPPEASIDACGNSTTIMATAPCSSPVYNWKYGNKLLQTGNSYTPKQSDFDGTGNLMVNVTVSSGGCTLKEGLKVYVPSVQEVPSNTVTSGNCGSVIAIDSRDNQRYCTVKIGSQCWMGKNLNVGTYQANSTSDFWKFDENGIQKWCYGNIEDNCAVYGGLYEWWEAVCGGQCNGNLTTAIANNLSFTSESGLQAYGAKMVTGNSMQVQGICPDGWHMPSDGEWQVLEMQLGMSSSQANSSGARGNNQGSQMKTPGSFGSYDWCSGVTCNSSGLSMLPGGRSSANGNGFSNTGTNGYWWSSTPYNTNAVWVRMLAYNATTVTRSSGMGYNNRSYGFSVRCVMN